MKFIAIAALVATATAADVAQDGDCSASGSKCATGLCCGKAEDYGTTAMATGETAKMDALSTTTIPKICNTDKATKWVLTTTKTSDATNYNKYLTSGKAAGKYVAKFTCDPATGAASLSAAAAVLAASFYMA